MDDRAWVLTCDPGIDDAVALAVASGRADCTVAAVVAGAGNVDATTAWRNAVGLTVRFGLDVPVAIGSATALDGRPLRRAGTAHGLDGLGGLGDRLALPAGHVAGVGDHGVRPGEGPPGLGDDGAIRRAVATGGLPVDDGIAGWSPAVAGPLVRGDLVALGPLTDVARAIRSGQPICRVVWMGGGTVVSEDGPAVAEAEFNAGADPVAADEVLGSPAEVAVVPLTVTRRVVLTPDDLGRWRSGPPAARLCAELAATRLRPAGVALHDPVALVAAVEPRLFAWRSVPLRCVDGDREGEGDGHPRGALVTGARDDRRVRLAVAVDADAVRHSIVDAVLAIGERP